MWHRRATARHDGIAILSFKSKMHTIGSDVLDGVQRAIEEAERNWRALVIWQTEPPFSAGANLQKATERLKSDEPPSAFGLLAKKLKKTAQSAVLKAARSLESCRRPDGRQSLPRWKQWWRSSSRLRKTSGIR